MQVDRGGENIGEMSVQSTGVLYAEMGRCCSLTTREGPQCFTGFIKSFMKIVSFGPSRHSRKREAARAQVDEEYLLTHVPFIWFLNPKKGPFS